MLPSAVNPAQLTHVYGSFFFFSSFPCFMCSHCWFVHAWSLFSQMPTLGIPLKLCEPRAFASGSSLGHVPTHLASAGHCRAAGALLHTRLELGDHWQLCPDRDGPWYGAFSLPSGSGRAVRAWLGRSAQHGLAKAYVRTPCTRLKCDRYADTRLFTRTHLGKDIALVSGN